MPAIIIPKGHFIVMKTGTHPMRTRLRLFLEWGITFGEPYSIPEKAARSVAYANMYLKDRADSEGRCWPGIRTIAAELGFSRSTVKRALDDLYGAGLLTREPRWRENGSLSSNLYRLV